MYLCMGGHLIVNFSVDQWVVVVSEETIFHCAGEHNFSHPPLSY